MPQQTLGDTVRRTIPRNWTESTQTALKLCQVIDVLERQLAALATEMQQMEQRLRHLEAAVTPDH